MNKYVVALWNDNKGELLQEVVEANSKLDAVVSYMGWERLRPATLEEAYSLAANMDAMFNVIEITVSKSRTNSGPTTTQLPFYAS